MITNIRLQHFRSYTDESFEFNPEVTIIVGPNASGKTNLLEAILVAARGVSYRAKDTDLVQFDAPWSRLDAQTDSGDRTVKLTPDQAVKKSYIINETPLRRLPLTRTLPVVVFEPNHLRLLAGSPERRRSYLDEVLTQTVPTYATSLRKYRQALAQRNALLKHFHHRPQQDQLFVWNIRLSQLAGEIVRDRTDVIAELQRSITELYQTLSHSDTEVTVDYDTPCNIEQYESSMLRRLEQQHDVDVARGFTGTGPHRDDMAVWFDGRLGALSASRGETRTAVLALKILELNRIETVREQKPLLLLDDVFSELDGARRHALTNYLSRYQTFITTTDADIALQSFSDVCTVIPLGGRG